MNRLNWAREILDGGAEQWKQQFTYDRYGNRTINTSATYGAGINNKAFAVSTANNNQLVVPAGQSGTMSYDAAGNLTNDTYTGAGNRTYDAENRITSAWGGLPPGQAQLYTYNASGQRIKRTVDGVETWAVYGMDGEMVAEYAASGATSSPLKEYGYRNGQLLVTAEPASSSQSTQNVSWANAVGVTVSGNSLTKTAADGWNNSGASSSQSFASGDGYMEFTASETNMYRMIGLSSGDTNQDFTDIDFAAYLGGGGNGTLCIYEAGVNRGCQSTFVTGDVIRVAVESGVVKYKKNGTTFYTSTVSPGYPLNVDTALYSNGSTINNVKISGNLSTGSGPVHWLVPDQLGTPRMIFDQTGSLANVKRHDYLPFGEELFGGTEQNPGPGGRKPSQGYSGGDGVRQQFTHKERDIETGLDYFGARYYASTQGRFTGADPYDVNFERQETADPQEANALFTAYIGQPQHWNHYSYALNNPLKYIDPDGLYEYKVTVLGQTVTVHIDDDIIKGKPDVLKRIQDNLQKAFDKINAGANDLTQDQIESIHSQNRINVSNYNPNATVGGTFYITQRTAENPNIDKLSADIIHDSRHSEQFARGLSYDEKTVIPMETEASQFAVDVMDKMGGFNADVRAGYQDDAKTGHFPPGSGWKDKSTPKSRAKVSETMQKPQKRRN